MAVFSDEMAQLGLAQDSVRHLTIFRLGAFCFSGRRLHQSRPNIRFNRLVFLENLSNRSDFCLLPQFSDYYEVSPIFPTFARGKAAFARIGLLYSGFESYRVCRSSMSSVKKVIAKLTQEACPPMTRKVLAPDELRQAIQRERSRADRREIPFSILVISWKSSEAFDLQAKISTAFDRLRLSDEIGHIDSLHLGILLPDTESDPACKVATDLRETLTDNGWTPKFEVFTYPFDGPGIDGENSDGNELVRKPPVVVDPNENNDEIQAQGLSFAVPMPFWKRTMDIVVSTLTLIVLSPFMLLAALLIKLTSKGPVFFVQWREGKCGRKFRILKFRTMTENAETLQHDLRHMSEQDGPAFKIHNDPRLTWFGAILRKSCFDETPQFFNILKGDMTLVGPRPLPVNESQACKQWQRRRLDVTPGMTCIWQVRGGRKVDFDQWMRMDRDYVRQSSFLTDAFILMKTAVFVFMRRASV